MSEGLITRIGKWIDSKFEEKVTRAEFEALKKNSWIGPYEFDTYKVDNSKELSDLKARIEKLEIYSGLKRTMPGTKTPIEKSAFAM